MLTLGSVVEKCLVQMYRLRQNPSRKLPLLQIQ